ncbi:protein lin-37 homolog isoform 1-T1 [Spinachia spinachia]
MHHVKIKTERQDAEAAGARSRLDSVLKGLLERSASEKEQNEGDTGKMSADSLNKYGSEIYFPCSLECMMYCSWSCEARKCCIIPALNIKYACFEMSCFPCGLKGFVTILCWKKAGVYFSTELCMSSHHISCNTCVRLVSSSFRHCFYFSRPSARFPQHRRKKRKEMEEGIPEANQHKQNAYIIKLFDRSVDLAQFNTSTPLYPICRAWMRNNPSVRAPPASPSPPHIMVEEELTDMINGKGQNVYRLPPPTSCPISTSGEPVNLRIPQTEKPTVNKLADSLPVPGSLICDHMERWKKIRQKWKECSNKNQLRYSESIKVLKEMKELYDR